MRLGRRFHVTLPVYARLLIGGAIFSIAILFSPELARQVPAAPQTVSTLPPSSERWALVVGVSKYDDPNFNPLYGQDDAKKIARDLEQYAGFDHDQIILLTDDQPADRQPRKERMLWWLSVLKQNASPQGLLLVFFSGHGMVSGGESFLMPQDAHLNFDKTYLEQNAVPVDVVSKSLRESHSKQVIVLVDACRSNPYAAAGPNSNKMTSVFASSFDYEKQNLDIRAYATIFSTSVGEESYQYHSERMGYFSWVLDQALSGVYDTTGQITLQNLIDDLEDHVPKLVKLYSPGRTQTPDTHLGGYLASKLVLVGGHAPSPSGGSMVRPRPPARGEIRVNPIDGLKYVWIPPGTFEMGCSPGDQECLSNEPAHQVMITEGFWMGQTEVKVAAYRRFARSEGAQMPPAPDFNPKWGNSNMPILNTIWDDARAYCTWIEGRLPTEAEWEYAARAGSTASRYGPLDDVAWYSGNSGGRTHEVAHIKRPNAWNLADMLGNVYEWVGDWYADDYYLASPQRDPQGPPSGRFHVVRGGSWKDGSTDARASHRGWHVPGVSEGDGFRCVWEPASP